MSSAKGELRSGSSGFLCWLRGAAKVHRRILSSVRAARRVASHNARSLTSLFVAAPARVSRQTHSSVNHESIAL
jgi:hypothetical protein